MIATIPTLMADKQLSLCRSPRERGAAGAF
jgi:hypothetical protein